MLPQTGASNQCERAGGKAGLQDLIRGLKSSDSLLSQQEFNGMHNSAGSECPAQLDQAGWTGGNDDIGVFSGDVFAFEDVT